MHGTTNRLGAYLASTATVEAVSRAELEGLPQWRDAFSDAYKDRRYYEVVEDTLTDGFEYGYFLLKDATGQVFAVQPFFLLDQDMVDGINGRVKKSVDAL